MDCTFVVSSSGIIQVAQMILCLMAFVCVQASEWCRKLTDAICETIPDIHMLSVFLFLNMAVFIATIIGYTAFAFGIHKKLPITNWNMANAIFGSMTMIVLLVAICFLASNIGVYISGLPGITAGLCIDFVAFINSAGYVFFNINEWTKRNKAEKPNQEDFVDGGQAVFTGGLSAGEVDDFERPEGEPTLSAMRPLSSSRSMKDCYEVDLSGGRSSKLGGASVSSAEKRGSECSSDSSHSFENAVELVITEAKPVHS